jgi:hypothetical protein
MFARYDALWRRWERIVDTGCGCGALLAQKVGLGVTNIAH